MGSRFKDLKICSGAMICAVCNALRRLKCVASIEMIYAFSQCIASIETQNLRRKILRLYKGTRGKRVAAREIIQIDTNLSNIFVQFGIYLFNLTALRASPFCLKGTKKTKK